ncbi:MAG: rRNA maturation RNase YbeY [Planctomycetota bacterium]
MPPLPEPETRPEAESPSSGLSDEAECPPPAGAAAIDVQVADEQSKLAIQEGRVRDAVRAALADASVEAAQVSVALVSDETIHRVNHEYLRHDYPTDVISFTLSEPGEPLQGEVVVSTDTAASNAAEFGRTPVDETLLYVVHGTLHLVGYEDKEPEAAAEMRLAESRVLGALGVTEPQPG